MAEPLKFTPVISRSRLEATIQRNRKIRIMGIISEIYIFISLAAACSCAGLGIRMLMEHM